MDGVVRVRRRHARRTVVFCVMWVVSIAALLSGCTGEAVQSVEGPAAEGTEPPEATTLTWDPSVVLPAEPGLVGWSRAGAKDVGALVSISPDSAGFDVLWQPPEGSGVIHTPLALDAESRKMLLEVMPDDAIGGQAVGLVMLEPDGSARELELPAGYEGISSATFVDGRALVVVNHATSETFDTLIGLYSESGAWQPVDLAGPLPDHQFVEWAVAVPGTDSVAVLLKVPGGTGDRDDDALVLTRLDGGTLSAYTDAFMDDSLPGASTLYGDEGVLYPRTWREVDGAPVVDLVIARWNGSAWDEVVFETPGIASGIETGRVAAQGPDGTLWLRSEPADAGMRLASMREGAADTVPTDVSMDSIDWFTWVDAAVQ
jgi:hypothetical protein